TGASYVFGPQKGATPERIEELDKNLKHYGNIIKDQLGIEVDKVPGAGAAGGLGAGLMAFLSAKLVKGIDLVVEHIQLESQILESDQVSSGEGQLALLAIDGNSRVGGEVIAKEYSVPTIVLAGSIGDDVDVLYDYGITSILGILKSPCTLEDALDLGEENIESASENN